MTTPRAHGPRPLANVAGEFEREAKSRRANALEAIGLYLLVLFALWPLAYGLGIMGGVSGAETMANVVIGLGVVFIAFVAPFLHRDRHTSWGLGNPVSLWRFLKAASPGRRWTTVLIIVVLMAFLNILNWWQWAEVADFFKFDGTVLEGARDGDGPGQVFVLGFGIALSLLIATCAIRYDNFLSALRAAVVIALPVFLLICIGAWVQRGAAAFADFDPVRFGLGVLGYLFWGFTQQLLFSGYFGTRLRKAFSPSASPRNVVLAGKRWRWALGFGAAAALIGGPGIFFLLRALYTADLVRPAASLWFMVFLFPAGAIYGYFYARDKKRMLVATLTASFFGLIHIDSYGLVLGTWLLGIPLAYIFMEDRFRNLVALGFIHGLNGATLQWLFSRGRSGALEIDYSVGPWNVDAPVWGVIILPLLFLAAYAALFVWCARRLPASTQNM
ncbi:MAG: hypothetical protein ACLFTT_10900 [Candidatus Hydrogenedentota bacterium]